MLLSVCVCIVDAIAGWGRSTALRELILAEIWRLLDSEPGISGALDDRVQVQNLFSCYQS